MVQRKIISTSIVRAESKELEIIDAIKLRDELTLDFYVPYHHGWVDMHICTLNLLKYILPF